LEPTEQEKQEIQKLFTKKLNYWGNYMDPKNFI